MTPVTIDLLLHSDPSLLEKIFTLDGEHFLIKGGKTNRDLKTQQAIYLFLYQASPAGIFLSINHQGNWFFIFLVGIFIFLYVTNRQGCSVFQPNSSAQQVEFIQQQRGFLSCLMTAIHEYLGIQWLKIKVGVTY